MKDLKILSVERIENLSFKVASVTEKIICMGPMMFQMRQVDNNQPYELEISKVPQSETNLLFSAIGHPAPRPPSSALHCPLLCWNSMIKIFESLGLCRCRNSAVRCLWASLP